jgi:hypothetical protein
VAPPSIHPNGDVASVGTIHSICDLPNTAARGYHEGVAANGIHLKSERVVIRIDGATKRQLDSLAARVGRPVSHLGRLALSRVHDLVPASWLAGADVEQSIGARRGE